MPRLEHRPLASPEERERAPYLAGMEVAPTRAAADSGPISRASFALNLPVFSLRRTGL